MIFEILKEKIYETLEEIKSINYWKKIEHKFIKAYKNKLNELIINVKHNHNIFSKFQTDSEGKLGYYANKYGYKLIEEQLGFNNSTYRYKLIKLD